VQREGKRTAALPSLMSGLALRRFTPDCLCGRAGEGEKKAARKKDSPEETMTLSGELRFLFA